MAELFISFLVFLIVIAIMAIGVIFGRAPIKGSCGGMGALGIDTACEICGGSPARCAEERGESVTVEADRFYNADRS